MGTHATPGPAPRREVRKGVAGTHGAPGPTPRRELGAGAAGTHGAPEAALRREVGTGAAVTCGSPGAALRREVGAGAAGTHGSPGAALSREPGTTPPPPPPCPSKRGQGVVVPITPPDNPHGARLASRWCLIVLSSPLQPLHRCRPRSLPPLVLRLSIPIGVRLWRTYAGP
jgi:hypothetical protein